MLIDPDIAAIWSGDPTQEIKKCRFAGARATQECDELATSNRQPEMIYDDAMPFAFDVTLT
jgi:hypothetical protein